MLEFLKDILRQEDKPTDNYFKRNSGKKLMATILEPTEAEIKQNDTAN